MVQLSTILASLSLLLVTSTAPLIVPLRSAGQTLSISDDGQTITLGAQSINIRSAMNGAGPCERPHGMNKGELEGNSVVALKVAPDGTLSDGSITSTRGSGMVGVDVKGVPAVPDGTFSQGALQVAGNMLIAANPGSNTITMFTISSTDTTNLTMVGQPVSRLGEFPNSVTISISLSQACVANTGAVTGIACFSVCSTKGLTPLNTQLRPIKLNHSTPPVGPTNAISQTFFNSDSTALITTVKGDPAVNNTDFLSIFPIENGVVSKDEARSSPAETVVLFGTALLPSSKDSLFITDASFGSATLLLSSDNKATITAQTKIQDQAATCWATYSELTGTAYVTDVAKSHLVEVVTVTGELILDLESTNENPGMVALVSAGNFVCALSAGNATVKAAVTVFDIGGGKGAAKEIQNFNPKGVEVTAQGMAFV